MKCEEIGSRRYFSPPAGRLGRVSARAARLMQSLSGRAHVRWLAPAARLGSVSLRSAQSPPAPTSLDAPSRRKTPCDYDINTVFQIASNVKFADASPIAEASLTKARSAPMPVRPMFLRGICASHAYNM